MSIIAITCNSHRQADRIRQNGLKLYGLSGLPIHLGSKTRVFFVEDSPLARCLGCFHKGLTKKFQATHDEKGSMK